MMKFTGAQMFNKFDDRKHSSSLPMIMTPAKTPMAQMRKMPHIEYYKQQKM